MKSIDNNDNSQNTDMSEEKLLDEREEFAPERKSSFRKKILLVAGVFLVIAATAFYGLPKVYYAWNHESTDDAFVEGTIVSIASEVSGKICALYVDENQQVKMGDVLAEIDPDEYMAGVKQAEANVSSILAEKEALQSEREQAERKLAQAQALVKAAKAEAELAEKDLARHRGLLEEGVIPEALFDEVLARYRAKDAKLEEASHGAAEVEAFIKNIADKRHVLDFRLEEAKAILEQSKLDFSRTIITSPINGIVAKKGAEVGKFAEKGKTLFMIVQDSSFWVTANFKETQTGNMRIGQEADIKIDAYPGSVLKGRVESFKPGTGAVFSILPPENASGNFVKVVQRLPVRIALESRPDTGLPLRAGLSVEASVRVR